MTIKRLSDKTGDQFEFEIANQEKGTIIISFCDNPNCRMLHISQVQVGHVLVSSAEHAREISLALAEIADDWDGMLKGAKE